MGNKKNVSRNNHAEQAEHAHRIERRPGEDGIHPYEVRFFAYEGQRSFCIHEKCPCFGKDRVAGVCYPDESDASSKRLAALELAALDIIASIKKEASHKESDKRSRAFGKSVLNVNRYTEALENHFISAWINGALCLDETILLRAAKARLSGGKRVRDAL